MIDWICHLCANTAEKQRYWGGRLVPICRTCEALAEAGRHPEQPQNQGQVAQ